MCPSVLLLPGESWRCNVQCAMQYNEHRPLYVIIFGCTIGFLLTPALRSTMAKEVSTTDQGRLQGGMTFLTSLATAFGKFVRRVR
jgi:hypothetical protein